MKLQLVKATTSQTALVFIQDSSSTTGAGLAGLLFNSASLTWYYYREAAGTGGTQVTLATQTIGTWASGGFIELDATDMPGWYEIGIPDAALATGAGFVGMVLKGATNMAQLNIEIQLTSMDLNDAIDGGMASIADWTDGGRLDLILDIIAADTTTDIPALIATAQADLDIITDSDGVIIGAAGIDLVWDEVLTGATHNVNNSSGKRLRQISATIFDSGTAQAGAANTITLAAGASAVDQFFRDSKVILTENTGAGQEAVITDYAGSTKIATITPAWRTNPDNTTLYEVIPAQVHATTQNGGYDGGRIFFDSVNGEAGTLPGVHGISTNPSNTEANLYTIATGQKSSHFEIEAGSTLTLPSNSDNKEFTGASYTLALNSQSISNSRFEGALNIAGTATGAIQPFFDLCNFISPTMPPFGAFECSFSGTVTLGSAGDTTIGTSAGIAGTSPTFTLPSSASASNLSLLDWRDGVLVKNMGQGGGAVVVTITGSAQLTLDATDIGGTVIVHSPATVDKGASTGVTVIHRGILEDPAADHNTAGSVGAAINDILTDTGATIPGLISGLNDITAASVWTTALTESYAADGSTFTGAQAFYQVWSALSEFAISGTTITAKKLDGSATSMTFTLDDGTTPTSRTRAT